MWSEADPQAATEAQERACDFSVSSSEHLPPGGLGCGQHPGGWRVHCGWRGGPVRRWTSDHCLLLGGRPVFCVGSAMLSLGHG